MKNSIRLILFILTLQLLTGCSRPLYPLTEKDCIKESAFIINKVKVSQYDSVLLTIKKYPDYTKYDLPYLKKEYSVLTNYLKENKNLNYYYKFGNEKITESNMEGIITNIFAIYYCTKDTLGLEKKLCQFNYTFSNNKYGLNYMHHGLHKKVQPSIPVMTK